MGKGLVILFALLLTGCATTKTIEHEEYGKNVFNTNEIKSRELSYEHFKTILDSLHTIHTFVFDVYDTDKEPDSVGNYPLKMHGVVTDETQRTTTTAETASQSTITTDSVSIYTETEKYDYTRKTKKSYPLSNIICLFVIVGLVCGAYKIFKR